MTDPIAYVKVRDLRHLVKTLLITAIFNTVIAGLLYLVQFRPDFGITWVYSQCVGLTICASVMSAFRLFSPERLVSQAAAVMLSITVGAITGMLLGSVFVWLLVEGATMGDGIGLQVVGISIIFGAAITYYFHSREKLAASVALANEERIKRLSGEKQILEADLKRLQAQIEPHFLFNTLSNIVSLMDSDVAKAKAMQMDLIGYLRSSLKLTRDRSTTLGEEFERLRSYLDIYQIRMGDRLQYDLKIPAALTNHPFSPMLLQPLVENAVIHGLEPKIDGGRIQIEASTQEGLLQLTVADTGSGMGSDQQAGIGLNNVKERIESLFGANGELHIEENKPSGLRVMIQVPLEGDARE